MINQTFLYLLIIFTVVIVIWMIIAKILDYRSSQESKRSFIRRARMTFETFPRSGVYQPISDDLDSDQPPQGSGVPSRIDESLRRETFQKSMGHEFPKMIDPTKIRLSDSGSIVPAEENKNELLIAFCAGFNAGGNFVANGSTCDVYEEEQKAFVQFMRSRK